jgi:amidase
MSAQGPLARNVKDARIALRATAQRDPRDPWWVPAPLEYPKSEPPIKIAKAKIPADMESDPEIRALYDYAGELLLESGHQVEEVELPDLEGVWACWRDVLTSETEALGEQAMRALATPDFLAVYDGMKKGAQVLDRDGFMRAITQRNTHIRAWQIFFETYPVILAPASLLPTPAPRADLGGEDAVYRIFRQNMRFISAINVLGLPAAVVPIGLAHNHPVGVQLIAGRYREDLCLDVAQTIEAQAGRLIDKLWRDQKKQDPAESAAKASPA